MSARGDERANIMEVDFQKMVKFYMNRLVRSFPVKTLK